MVEATDQIHYVIPTKKEPSLAETLPLQRWPPRVQSLIFRVDVLATARPYGVKLALAAASACDSLGPEGTAFALYLYGVKSKAPQAVTSLLERISKGLDDQDIAMLAELTANAVDITEPPPAPTIDKKSATVRRPLISVLMTDPEFSKGAISCIREGQLPQHQAAVAKEMKRLRAGSSLFPEEEIRLYAQWNVGINAVQGFSETEEREVSKHAPFQGSIAIDPPGGKRRISTKTVELARQAQILLDQGLTLPQAAKKLGKHHTTIFRSLEAFKYVP